MGIEYPLLRARRILIWSSLGTLIDMRVLKVPTHGRRIARFVAVFVAIDSFNTIISILTPLDGYLVSCYYVSRMLLCVYVACFRCGGLSRGYVLLLDALDSYTHVITALII